MPFTGDSVFERIQVDYLMEGGARVGWTLSSSFSEPQPHTFQLQFSNSGVPTANDWVNVGIPVNDGFFAIDDQKRLFGKNLSAHYRVSLTTSAGSHVSNPANATGLLNTRDWILAKEIIRKERLRFDQFAAVDGYLLKRRRQHHDNQTLRKEVLDPITQEIISTRGTFDEATEDYGTGILKGYYPAIPLSIDISPESKHIDRDAQQMRGTTRDVAVKARVLAFPLLDEEDVWVDRSSDQRWFVHEIQHTSEIRSVPLIMDVMLRLVPFSHAVYRIPIEDQIENSPIGGENGEGGEPLPGPGNGSVQIDHNFGGPDELAYMVNGTGIVCATVQAFRKEDWEACRRSGEYIVAQVSTTGGGRWASPMFLDPGEYTLVFFKSGQFGPDTVCITVPGASSSVSISLSESSPGSSSSSSSL